MTHLNIQVDQHKRLSEQRMHQKPISVQSRFHSLRSYWSVSLIEKARTMGTRLILVPYDTNRRLHTFHFSVKLYYLANMKN